MSEQKSVMKCKVHYTESEIFVNVFSFVVVVVESDPNLL